MSTVNVSHQKSDREIKWIEMLNLAQLKPGEFKEAMTQNRPAVLICSVEFLSSKEVDRQ